MIGLLHDEDPGVSSSVQNIRRYVIPVSMHPKISLRAAYLYVPQHDLVEECRHDRIAETDLIIAVSLLKTNTRPQNAKDS